MLCLWFDGQLKVLITCLKCHRPLTQATTSVKFQREQRLIGIFCLWDNVLISTPTLFCAECVQHGFWGRHPPDLFRHRQGSIITLLYSVALPVRQHKRHIRAAHGDRALERERERGECRGEERRGLLLTVVVCWGCAVAAHRQMRCHSLSLTYKVKDWGEVALFCAGPHLCEKYI